MTLAIKPVKVPAKAHNRFCGPAAVSIISGLDTAQSAALIREKSGRKAIMGTSSYEVARALKTLGFTLISAAKVNPLDRKSNPTLAAWLRETTKVRGSSVYLISAGQHWQVIQGRRFCCGITKEIVSIRDEKVKRRARITGVWRVVADVDAPARRELRREVVTGLKAASKRTPAQKAESSARYMAHRLAKQYDIEIETVRGVAPIVWGPTFVNEENDPYYGDHISQGWEDALRMVKTYVDLIDSSPHLFP